MGRFCRWCIEGKKENGFTTEAAEESRGLGELGDEVGIEERFLTARTPLGMTGVFWDR